MYGKIFETELDSSIVEESIPTRLLWHYLIVLADRDGNVDMTNPALARRVNIPLAQVEEALGRLAEPDPSSRSPEEGGRRVLPIAGQPFGWHLVNYQKYREIARYEDRLLQNREAQRRHRENRAQTDASATVSGRKKTVSTAEVETEGKGEDLASPSEVSDETSCGEALVGPPAGGRDVRPKKSAQVAEVEWRLQEVWETHKKARLRFFESRNGTMPPATPALTQEIRKAIREALREHDKGRLKEEERVEWKRSSPVRAAGIGIFLSPFHRGDGKDADGTTYLEPWRPWKRQRGKPDPVEMFARFYFDERSRRGK